MYGLNKKQFPPIPNFKPVFIHLHKTFEKEDIQQKFKYIYLF